MNALSVLRYCREVLAERQQRDAWQGWFWQIRRKVIDYWIARLEQDAGSSAAAADLTPEEQQEIRRSHPLLKPRAVDVAPAYELHRAWQADLHARVHRYLEAVKSHR